MRKTLMNNQRKIFLEVHINLGQQYSCLCEGCLWKFRFEDSIDCFDSYIVISKNDLEGQQSYNVQDDQILAVGLPGRRC